MVLTINGRVAATTTTTVAARNQVAVVRCSPTAALAATGFRSYFFPLSAAVTSPRPFVLRRFTRPVQVVVVVAVACTGNPTVDTRRCRPPSQYLAKPSVRRQRVLRYSSPPPLVATTTTTHYHSLPPLTVAVVTLAYTRFSRTSPYGPLVVVVVVVRPSLFVLPENRFFCARRRRPLVSPPFLVRRSTCVPASCVCVWCPSVVCLAAARIVVFVVHARLFFLLLSFDFAPNRSTSFRFLIRRRQDGVRKNCKSLGAAPCPNHVEWNLRPNADVIKKSSYIRGGWRHTLNNRILPVYLCTYAFSVYFKFMKRNRRIFFRLFLLSTLILIFVIRIIHANSMI